MEFFIGIAWLALSIAIGVLASKRGRTGFGWFLLSCLLSPLIAGLFLLIAGQKEVVVPLRKCPMCAEMVRVEAVKCKHCGSDLSTTSVIPTTSASPVDPLAETTFAVLSYLSEGWAAVFVGAILCLASLLMMISFGFGAIASVVFLVGVGLIVFNVWYGRGKKTSTGN